MSTSPNGSPLSVTDLRTVIRTLATEVDLLRRLCSILEDEQRALVKGRVDDLESSVEAQIALIKEVADLEAGRRALVETGPARAGAQPVKIDALVELAPAEEAASLSSVKAALRDVVAALGRVNGQNSALIRQSLSYIDRNLRMAAGEDTASKVYNLKGEVKCPTGQIVINRKV